MAMQSQHTRLHWEVSALAECSAESDSQHSHKLATCAEIEALAKKLWGDSVSVAHHGSTHSGASLRGSDLDVVLAAVRDLPKPDNPGGNGYLPHKREMVASYLDDLKKILTEGTTLVSDLEIVRTARMPLLKAKLSGGIELKVTLSPLDVKDIPACQTAELVSKTFKELPHARKLLLILKALMRPPNCLNTLVGVHTGGVSSYTITLMVLAFCKFQAAQLNVSNVDLGSLFLSFLQFYSEPTHFDVTRHAIDVVVPSGFAQKHEVQAHLDAGVRQEMANRLCALEPISRHDIGQNSYRIKQVFEVMGGLRAHLASMNPYLSAGEADIEALRIMSSPRSYRTAVTPRQPDASQAEDPTFTSTWVERYLPLLGTILDVASIIPVKQEERSASGPPKGPPPQHDYPPGAIFVPGYGAMTLGQVSILSAQEAPLMGPHGHFGPDAFPTLQESVSVEATKSPRQHGRSSPSSSRSSPNDRQTRVSKHGMHGPMHGGFPGHAMYGMHAPHLLSEHSFQGGGRKGGHNHGHGGNGHGPLARGNSAPSQHSGGHRRGGGGGPHKPYHNRNHSFGSSSHTSFGHAHASNSIERGKPADTKAQSGGRNGSSPKRRNKTSPINIDRQQANMHRNGSSHLHESASNSCREREHAGGAPAARDGASESDSHAGASRSCPERSSVPPEELHTASASSGADQAKPAGENTFEKPLDKSFSRCTIDSSLGGFPGGPGSSAASTTALSMRSKSVGTTSSSAVSPMVLPLSPHDVPTVGPDSATPPVEPVATPARGAPESRISDSGSAVAAPPECKDKDSASSETTSTPSAAASASKKNTALQQHRGGEGRGEGRGEGPRGGAGFAPGGDRRFNNSNAQWGAGRSSGRRYAKGGHDAGRDGGSGGRLYNPGGGTGAFQAHYHSFGNSGHGTGRWGGPRNPQGSWNHYSGGSGQNSAQRGQMPPHGGPAGMHMVPVQLPVYPAYPNHSTNSPYVAPYYVMPGPQNSQAHAASASNTPEASANQAASHAGAGPATANGAQPQRQTNAAQSDDAAHAQPPPAGVASGAATPPLQSQCGGGKQQGGDPPQEPPAQPQLQAGGVPPKMLVPNHGPPGQGASSGGAPQQQGQLHSWPTPVLHPTAMMQQHPGGPSFMPQAVMYVALPTQHMQMPPGSENMPQFRHHSRGGGGVQGGLPHREHHTLPRNNSGKHRNGPGQGFDAHNSGGRGRGEGHGGRGSWHAGGGRGGFGRDMQRRNGGFVQHAGRHMGGRWRGEQAPAPEAT